MRTTELAWKRHDHVLRDIEGCWPGSADLTSERHDHVICDIRSMLEELSKDAPKLGDGPELIHVRKEKGARGVITLSALQEVPNDGPGPRTIGVYMIGKRDSYVVVAQLSPEFTALLVDRWQALETERARPLTQIDVLLQSVQLLANVEREQAAAEQRSRLPHDEQSRDRRPDRGRNTGTKFATSVSCSTSLRGMAQI